MNPTGSAGELQVNPEGNAVAPQLNGSIKPGIYFDLSNEDYHADGAIGSSGLKTFLELPALYWAGYLSPERPEVLLNSKQVRVGTYAHMALLEPEKFEKEYVIAPETCLSNEGKKNEQIRDLDNRTLKAWKDFEEQAIADGKKAMLYCEWKQNMGMVAAIKRKPLAHALLINGRPEVSFFAQDPRSGLMLKAKPDYLVKLPGYGNVMVDYKTTALPLSKGKQSNHAASLSRNLQASHHKRTLELATGGKIDEVVYVVQSQKWPYLIKIFRMPQLIIEKADLRCYVALDRMAKCFETGVWPEYPDEIEDYEWPLWTEFEIDNDY